MSGNNNRNTNAVARAIQERLAQAQQSQPPGESGSGQLRVTKDGRLLGADEVAPDGTTTVPSATFHIERE